MSSSEISVVIPLTDARGDSLEHLRTWTHGQTLPRERYELALASDGEDPAGDRAVAELLDDHDILETAPGAGLIELYNTAAGSASAPWLLFTENHCQGEPDCLERAVEAIEASPDLEAASIEHGHLTPAVVGELGARWFDQVYEDWFVPGAWRRLNLAGFVIRKDTFQRAGGLDARYGLFSTPLLSAQLDERRARVGHLPEARILHVHVDDIAEHHGYSADYAAGECEARRRLSPELAERYFGHRHLIWNRRSLGTATARLTARILAKELLRALAGGGKDIAWLSRELFARLPAAAAGPRLLRRLSRLRFATSELAVKLPLLPRRLRYRSYLRAQERIVTLTQLRWIESNGEEDAVVPEGVHPIEQLVPGALVEVHGLELRDGRYFRWAGPALSTRLTGLQATRELRLETGGLIGSPLASVRAAYLGGGRLDQTALSEEGSTLVVAIPAGGPAELTLLCRPLRVNGQADERRLALPIFSVDWRTQGAGSDSDAVPEPALAAE
jgi:hypothetical protein